MLLLVVSLLTGIYSAGITKDWSRMSSLLTRTGNKGLTQESETSDYYAEALQARRSAGTTRTKAPTVKGLTDEEIAYINDLREECKGIKKTRGMSQAEYIELKTQCLFEADPYITTQQLNYALQIQADKFDRNRKLNTLYQQYEDEQINNEIETTKVVNRANRRMLQNELDAENEAYNKNVFWSGFADDNMYINSYYDNY